MIDITSCPECGRPAEVTDRHVLESTDGPVEHATVVCVARHRFFMPAAGLERPPLAALALRPGATPVGRPARLHR
ncbi:MAG: hypothetical protein ABIS35_15340 [Terracoccus sp.]